MIKAMVCDIDGSIMPQGGPINPKVAEVFRILSDLGIKMGPATGKNCDYGRGLACGIGIVWDFIIGETGAQFLETTAKSSPPAFRQRKILETGNDLSIFTKRIELDIHNRTFALYDQRASYRPELKEGIVTLFPPGKDIGVTEEWVPYFEDIVKTYRLRLEIQRHSDGCIDVVPSAVNKHLGILTVCQLFDCEPRDILTVADGVNDAELVAETTAIAVGNAVPSLKEYVQKNGGYVAERPDGFGFLEGLLYFSEKGSFGKEKSEKIAKSIKLL
jgi:hydroxymethylpyrimidine pyrophosphatase-like HAD family hydrolase